MAYFANNPNCPQNFLSGVGFQFKINKLPGVSFFCQSANVPSLNLAVATQATRWNTLPEPGDEVNYDDLTVRFLVDEDMKNYMSIHNWIRYLGHPESSRDWAIYSDGDSYEEKTYSDGFLIVLDSNFNPKFRIKFQDLFPVSLGGLNFDSTYTDTEYFAVDATFKYSIYDIEEVGAPGFFTDSDYDPPTVSISHTLSLTDVRLEYFSANAQYLLIDQDIGEVPIDNGYGVLPLSTVKNLSLNGTSTYTITAVGRGGRATATTTVTVGTPQTNANRLCIAVIDENNNHSVSNMESKWTQFRTNYPDRMFYLLQPSSCASPDVLNCPPSFLEETDPVSITNPCSGNFTKDYQFNKFGIINTEDNYTGYNNADIITIDNIDKYGVIKIGHGYNCGQLSSTIAFLNTGNNLNKINEYVASGGVLWVEGEWVTFGCSNQTNYNTIMTLLGSEIRQDGDVVVGGGNFTRSTDNEIVQAGFPEFLWTDAAANYTGGNEIYTYSGIDYFGNVVSNKRPMVYERIGFGIVIAHGDVNSWDRSFQKPPQEFYDSFRNLV